MTRLSAFVSSWFFAPYPGSADLDLFKRLKYCEVDFQVVQVRRSGSEPQIFDGTLRATFERVEVDLAQHPPRTRQARETFARRVVEEHEASAGRHHVLLSHSNEVPSHEAALRIKTKHPDLPWVAYFGDVVSRNPYVRHMREYPLHEEDCLTEARTLERADVIICNNPYQRDLMTTGLSPELARRVVVIPHAFDACLYPSTSTRNERFKFSHLGMLYAVKRRATPVLKAIDLLLEVYPSLSGQFEFVFVGDDVPEADLTRWRQMQHRDHVRFEPSVGYLKSLSLMKGSDALVVIDGLFSPEDDGLGASPFFPGKLADYFGAGPPVLGVTMKRGPTADLLRARGELIADEDPERIAYVLKRYLENRVARRVPPAELRAEAVGAQMEAVLRAASLGPKAIAALPAQLDGLKRAAAESRETA